LVQQYSKNIVNNYKRWLGFIGKSKKLSSEHRLATPPLPSNAPLPEWYNPKKEQIKAPDGQEYVIYYADQTAEEHLKEEEDKEQQKIMLEEARRKKLHEEEFNEAQKWRSAHANGKLQFDLSGRTNILNTMQFPVTLGRDKDGNRWSIQLGQYRLPSPNYSTVNGLYVQMLPFKRRNGEQKGIDEFLKDPKFDYYSRGQTHDEPAPEAFLTEIRRYQPSNFVTANIALSANNSDNDPKVGHIETYVSKYHPNPPERHPSLDEKAKDAKEPLLIDWDNPGEENIKKIVKAKGLEGKIDALNVDATNRYTLFDLKNMQRY
jgi:hypothetical protein